MTDRELLKRFAAGDSSAFEELVRRHAGWIHRAAQRQLRNDALAEDATQAVFLVLVRKVHSLPASTPLAAWLHRVTIFTTREIARQEARRKRREETAAMMRPEQTSAEENTWAEIAPLLEAQMQRLRKKDRQVILLRFYAQRDFADIAAEMGITEGTARKRVERALQKLRSALAGRGIQQSEDLLGSTLVMHAGGMANSQLLSRIAGGAGSQIARQIATAVVRKFSLAKLGLVGASVGMMGIAALIAVAKLSPNLRQTISPQMGTMPAWLQAIANAPSEVPTYPAASVRFDEFIGHLQQAETRIKNLHIVHFQTTMQRRSSYNQPWENTPAKWEGSAWFDGDFRGRCRIYLSHDAQEWQPDFNNNATLWSDDSNDYGFDGTEGRTVRLFGTSIFNVKGKPDYRRTPTHEGSIDAGWPLQINNQFTRYFTGLAYSLQYIVQEGEDTIPPQTHESLVQKLLRYHRIAPSELLMVQSKINGVDAVGIQTRPYPQPVGWKVWWFDPSRGYALVRYEIHTYSSTPHGMRIDATQWKEAAPGIWFPSAGTAEQNYFDMPKGPPWCSRETYHADDVIANDPQFRPGIFQVPLPVGFMIQDRRKNPPALVMVGDDGEEKEIHMGEAMPRIKVDVPKPPKD